MRPLIKPCDNIYPIWSKGPLQGARLHTERGASSRLGGSGHDLAELGLERCSPHQKAIHVGQLGELAAIGGRHRAAIDDAQLRLGLWPQVFPQPVADLRVHLLRLPRMRIVSMARSITCDGVATLPVPIAHTGS